MNIFITNDDGYLSYGILGLVDKLSDEHSITVVAPQNPQSAAGHALTMHKPLRIKYYEDLSKKYKAKIYSCSGKPADCVTIGLDEVMDIKPDLVISGINIGGNLGTDILYSGTVSGALEASMMGYKAIATSLDSFELDNMDSAIELVYQFVSNYPIDSIGDDYILNINAPNIPYSKIKGIKVVEQGIVSYTNKISKGKDPSGNEYYWIGGSLIKPEDGQKDVNLIKKGYATITPISYMMTDKDNMKTVSDNLQKLK